MRPLRFVINPASGGRAGDRLARTLGERFPGRVHAIAGGLAAAVDAAAAEGGAAVACGGDGTASALLRAAGDRCPVGILPLGTGNDLARWLGWRQGGLDQRLARLATAPCAPLDLWRLVGPRTVEFCNYLSLGSDARVAGAFHVHRRRHPRLVALIGGKAVYAVLGAALPPVRLAARLAEPALPAWAGALIYANIPTYAGVITWHGAVRADDGRLDAFVLPGGTAFALPAAGARRAQRTAAGERLTLRAPCAAQADGEPLRLPAGAYRLVRSGQARVLDGR